MRGKEAQRRLLRLGEREPAGPLALALDDPRERWSRGR
jgi:hypothetical protein